MPELKKAAYCSPPEWVWSAHALRRAEERFPELDMDWEIRTASTVGKKTRRRIREMCKQAAAKYMGPTRFAGRYYLKSFRGVGFVVQAPNVIITVLDLRNRSCDEKE